MRLIIAGGREFDDYPLLCKALDYYLQNVSEPIEIVSGKARGADSLGERYAKERDWAIAEFPANWRLYGKAAGSIRNTQMAQYADAAIVFWNGHSRGSWDMIQQAKDLGLRTRVVRYEDIKLPIRHP